MVRLWDSKGSVNLLRISYISLTNLHTRRFGLTVSSRRSPSSFYKSYRMGRTSASTSLIPQLVQAVIPPQHDAFVDSKGSGNILRIICILPTSLHTRRFGLTVSSRRSPSSFYKSYRMGRTSASTSLIPQLVQAVIRPQHDASAGKDPPAGLSSIHSPTLGRVLYPAPW